MSILVKTRRADSEEDRKPLKKFAVRVKKGVGTLQEKNPLSKQEVGGVNL